MEKINKKFIICFGNINFRKIKIANSNAAK